MKNKNHSCLVSSLIWENVCRLGGLDNVEYGILSYEEAQMLSNVSKTLTNYEKANNEYNFSDESKKFGIRKELEFLLNSKIMKQATNKTSSLL